MARLGPDMVVAVIATALSVLTCSRSNTSDNPHVARVDSA